ncbi:MAG: hypothetical protein RMJ33_01590 [Saprospiraceae bacterium]|nr:hypothetical protein [Saprospiraceae bacterium]MDW8228504.1 hypothetical protein [Saprospiraceae bacterium]
MAVEPEAPPIEVNYETERGKPTPSLLHARLLARLTAYLSVHFGDRHEVFSELTLDIPGEKATPDICIYLVELVDFSHDEAKRTDLLPAFCRSFLTKSGFADAGGQNPHLLSFGIESRWSVPPTLQSIYVFSTPSQHEVFSLKNELLDPH